jgi:hypothetical protein
VRPFVPRAPRRVVLGCLAALCAGSTAARAVDEIQVYNAEINRPRQFSLQLHGNYIVKGLTEPEFPGGLVPDESLNGTPEFAYGLTDWWEVGAYLPYAVEPGPDAWWGGAKLRALFVSPHAATRRFFYGLNIELSWATEKFSPSAWGSEVRPIVGWRGRRVEFILNPIVDVPLSGDDRAAVFAPASRLAWIATPVWAFGLEHYADFGPLRDVLPRDEQQQELYAVADRSGRSFDLDFGVGHGFTPASNDWTVKFILSWSF